MSVETFFEKAEHTFVNWIERETAKVEKAAPSIEQSTEAAAKWATGVLMVVGAQMEPGSAAAGIVKTAIIDIKTVSAVVYDAGASPTISSMWSDITTNLGGLEKAVGVKSPGALATVAKVISTIAALAEGFAALAPMVA